MHLARLGLQNFTAYRRADIPLGPTGLTLLIGPNNAGKSALLRAVDVVAGTRQVEGTRHAGASERVQVHATFELTEGDREAVLDGATAREEWLKGPALSRLEMTFTDLSDGRLYLDSIRTPLLQPTLHPVAEVESMNAAGHGAARVLNWNWVRQVDPRQIGPAHEVPWSNMGSGGDPDFLESTSVMDRLAPVLAQWRERAFHFYALRPGTTPRRPMGAAPVLTTSGENLPEVLLHIYTNERALWEELSSIVEDVLPEIGTLEVRTDASEVYVVVADPNTGAEHNLKNVGTGVEQLLLTAVIGARQNPGSLLIVEEPETNLHPAAQRQLLRYLRRWAEQRPVLVSTHSTVFLDQASSQEAVWLVDRKDSVSTATPAATSLPDILNAIGVRLSDVLSHDKVLLVEGHSDADVFRTWFGDRLEHAGVLLLPTGGGDRAWQAEMMDEVFRAADQIGRTLLVIRDRDELTQDQVDRLEKHGVAHVLARRELENYLLDPKAIARVLDARADAGESVEPLTTARVEAVALQAADDLLPTVVFKRTAAHFAPIRLTPRQEVSAAAATDPTVGRLVDLIGSQLPERRELEHRVRATWDLEQSQVTENWSENRLHVAPGEEILKAIWQAAGSSYDKRRDGQRLAAAMTRPPSELADRLDTFIGR